jgi:cell division septation protein DedD
VSQILSLALVARDSQEELLFLPRVVDGRDPFHEKKLRPIPTEVDGKKQREMFDALRAVVGNQ